MDTGIPAIIEDQKEAKPWPHRKSNQGVDTNNPKPHREQPDTTISDDQGKEE